MLTKAKDENTHGNLEKINLIYRVFDELMVKGQVNKLGSYLDRGIIIKKTDAQDGISEELKFSDIESYVSSVQDNFRIDVEFILIIGFEHCVSAVFKQTKQSKNPTTSGKCEKYISLFKIADNGKVSRIDETVEIIE